MTSTGNNLQQSSVAAPATKPATPESFVVNTARSALPVKKSSAMQPPPLLENPATQIFVAPPPLLKARSGVKRSYTSLKAMANPNPSESLTRDSSLICTPLLTNVTSEEVIDDSKAVSDLCQALNSGEGITICDEKTPSITRSTMYSERSLTAKDIIKAIDEAWGRSVLPTCEIVDK